MNWFINMKGLIMITVTQSMRGNHDFRAEVRRSFITTTVRDESQVTPQGRHR